MTRNLGSHPYILLSHGHCLWGQGGGVGVLIQLELSISSLELAPETAPGHPLGWL